MTVFISYSHSDSEIVTNLASHLVKHNANIWIDTWELNAGDSIIERVQDAVQESSALLVVLSTSSTKSQWCKKELSAGLVRELDEKRVVVVPVLIEDCEIPLFLKDKMYADFRHDFDLGLRQVLDAIGKVSNLNQGRVERENGDIDWAHDWFYLNDKFHIRFTIIQPIIGLPMTLLTEVQVECNEAATQRYQQFQDEKLGWIGRGMIAEMLFEAGVSQQFKLILNDQFPKSFNFGYGDSKSDIKYSITGSVRKLGLDTGKDQLIDISDYLKEIRGYIRHVSREPSRDETKKILKIVSTPYR